MTTQSAANLAIIFSMIALAISLLGVSYLYFAVSHWDDHVYVDRNIEQLNKFVRIRCTGNVKEACAIIVPIERPENYNRYQTQKR